MEFIKEIRFNADLHFGAAILNIVFPQLPVGHDSRAYLSLTQAKTYCEKYKKNNQIWEGDPIPRVKETEEDVTFVTPGSEREITFHSPEELWIVDFGENGSYDHAFKIRDLRLKFRAGISNYKEVIL